MALSIRAAAHELLVTAAFHPCRASSSCCRSVAKRGRWENGKAKEVKGHDGGSGSRRRCRLNPPRVGVRACARAGIRTSANNTGGQSTGGRREGRRRPERACAACVLPLPGSPFGPDCSVLLCSALAAAGAPNASAKRTCCQPPRARRYSTGRLRLRTRVYGAYLCCRRLPPPPPRRFRARCTRWAPKYPQSLPACCLLTGRGTSPPLSSLCGPSAGQNTYNWLCDNRVTIQRYPEEQYGVYGDGVHAKEPWASDGEGPWFISEILKELPLLIAVFTRLVFQVGLLDGVAHGALVRARTAALTLPLGRACLQINYNYWSHVWLFVAGWQVAYAALLCCEEQVRATGCAFRVHCTNCTKCTNCINCTTCTTSTTCTTTESPPPQKKKLKP